MAGIAGYGKKWLEMVGNGWNGRKWLNKDGHCWKWLELDGNGWKLQE